MDINLTKMQLYMYFSGDEHIFSFYLNICYNNYVFLDDY